MARNYGGKTITIYDETLNNGEPVSFSWSADIPVCFVIVKTGNVEGSVSAHLYKYECDSPVRGDTGLGAPDGKGISHVTFCWNGPEGVVPDVPLGTVMAIAAMMVAFGAYLALRKPKSIPL
jgi:hypothetical protein